MTRNLLLFPLFSGTCGVWERDVDSIAAARPLHRLPLSPAVVAGVTVIDDRSVTIFDLNACLGMPAPAPQGAARYLLLKNGDRTSGFAVAGRIETFPCPDDRVLPLPAAVHTDVVASCTVRGEEVIPLIDLRRLHDRLQQGIPDAPVPRPAPPLLLQQEAASARLRLFSLGGERFCAAGEGVSIAGSAGRKMTALPYAGDRAAGVLFHDGGVVPVHRLAARLGIAGKGAEKGLLLADIGGARHCFPVDEDLGTAERGDLLPLPPIARTAWMREAAAMGSGVVPLIDLAAVLAGAPGSAEIDRDRLYAPTSGFSARFQRENVEIMEVGLLGAQHAIPREEVKDVLPPVAYRPIPGVSEIVLGVAEVEGSLLPVVDLGAVFGRSSTDAGRGAMVRLSNGDFQALVAVGKAGEDRILTKEMQRRVPIALPHQVLYGCYLDERAVRLILNVHALAVHFERTELRDLVAGLAPPAPEQVISEGTAAGPVVAAALPGEGKERSVPSASYEPVTAAAREREEEAARARLAAEGAAQEERRKKEEAEQAAALAEAMRLREEAEAAAQREAEARARSAEEQRAAEAARLQAEEAERHRVEEEARRMAAAEAARLQEQREAETRAAAEAARLRAEEDARMREEQAAAQQAEESAKRELEALQAAAEQQRVEEQARTGTIGQEQLPEATAEDRGDRSPTAAEPPKRGVRKRLIAAAAVIAAIAFLLLSGGPPHQEDQQTPAPPPPLPKAEISREPEAALVLKVPASRPVPEQVIYIVVRGDTLWDISRRFTGDPFNYPRVARDNRIATPDLIFPGQTIRLERDDR